MELRTCSEITLTLSHAKMRRLYLEDVKVICGQTLNSFRNLTFRRAFNAYKIFISYFLSIVTRKPIVWGKPVFFYIEPTNRCNFQCPECSSGQGRLTRPIGMMDTGIFQKLIDLIALDTFSVHLYLQGESYINKQIYDMISYARQKKLYVSVSTNGSLIRKNNAGQIIKQAPDRLIFSMDGLDEDSYKAYRVGGTFAQADAALNLLIETKKKLNAKTPFIELQFIVMKSNEHQVDEVIRYGKMLGVDKVTLKTMQISSAENARKFMPRNKKYSRYILDGEDLKIKSKLKNQCFELWKTSVVTWDGKIVPCCFDKDAMYPLGDINQKSFTEIWHSEKYQEFRKRILENRRGASMCNNCNS